ncbi:hypothetical protein [Deinococcus cellulosilyticus]|uniref:DUF4412 domain-containing protein n=1 Tax=Deinococcus cellulosilyticus (strain DSM 18568 / NBRC 106333 / KACC 11606 / 5516J-15) TaxID=1223518 RepID=A0A511N4F8_DEIC1|nr:hypothetical protein [Deinococcus cellulosilyticus]GEM47749.1 hypothetical protein DC3_33840 [Deinococcus cellulosilyticus NBRC 106333 = KACC 11606]
MKSSHATFYVSLSLALVSFAQAADTIRMTAKPGTTLTGTFQSNTQILDMKASVSPQPGKKVSKEELEQYKNTFANVPKNLPNTTQSFPATLKVLATKPDGSTPVQMKMQIPMGQEGKNSTITINTFYSKNGKISMKLEPSKDPMLQKIMQGLTDSLLNNKESQLFYQKAWNVGESVTQTVSMPFDQFTGGAPVKFSGDFKVTTKTTYKGKNAAGEFVFQSTSTAKNSVLKATDAKGRMVMQMNIASLSGTSETRIRPDGLPGYSKTNQTMKMTMTLNTPEMPVQVKTDTSLKIEQVQTWKQK